MTDNIRRAQQKTEKDKSIYITLPIKETGINPGDHIMFEIVNEKIVLTKIKKEELEKENFIILYINKLLQRFGLHTLYELRKRNEVNVEESTDSSEFNEKAAGVM